MLLLKYDWVHTSMGCAAAVASTLPSPIYKSSLAFIQIKTEKTEILKVLYTFAHKILNI